MLLFLENIRDHASKMIFFNLYINGNEFNYLPPNNYESSNTILVELIPYLQMYIGLPSLFIPLKCSMLLKLSFHNKNEY